MKAYRTLVCKCFGKWPLENQESDYDTAVILKQVYCEDVN